MRAGTVILLTLIVVVVAMTVGAYAFLAAEGLSARKKPSDLEYSIANRALGISIPMAAKNLKNPLPSTAENVAEGRKHYVDQCAVCHAENGSGETAVGKGLSPPTPDLRAGHIQDLSDGELFYIVKNGVRFTGMPAWDVEDEHNWRLVLFMRALPKIAPVQASNGAGK